MAIKTPSHRDWSIREQLCLASAVMRSGDQNWMSVSRAIKPFPEPGRPPDWNKPKNCAIQYSSMLGEVDTPKRKRTGDKRDIVETPGDLIVKKMTFDRVEELKSMIADDKRKFKLLRDDIERIESGALDEKLPEILQDIHDLRKKRVAEAQKLAAEVAAAEILDKKEPPKEKVLLPPPPPYKPPQKQPEPVKKEETVTVPTVAANLKQEVSNVTKVVASPTKDVLPPVRQEDTANIAKTSDTTKSAKTSDTTKSAKTSDTAKSTKTSPQPKPKPTTPGHAPVLTNLLVTETKQEKRTKVAPVRTPEILSDLKSILAKPSEQKDSQTTAAPAEAPGPAEKTPTLSKLLTSTKSYQGQQPTPSSSSPSSSMTKPTVETKPVVSTPKKAAIPEKIPTTVEKTESKEKVEVAVVVEDILPPRSPSVVHLLITKPGLENEDSSDLSLVASPGPSSPVSTVKLDEQRKRKRGRPKKKRDVTTEDESVEIQSVGESADETKDGARSEAAESEGRPSESDRDDVSATTTLQGSMIGIESLPNSPASITQLDDNQRSWKKAIMLVWREAASHKYANLFLNPVTDDIARGYSSVVYRRMDLSNIKKNIEAGNIKSTETFQRDIMVMFQNAIMYNRSDHDVYRMAVDMQSDVLKSIEEFKSTQLLVQNPEVSKTLRGRERRADVSQKDEEKKRNALDPEHLTGKKRRTRADEV